MIDGDFNNVERALGILEGTVRSLMDQWARQDVHATEARHQMHQKLELLAQQIDRVANDAENIQQDIAEMRNDIDNKIMPTVERIRAEWERRLGAKAVLAIVWAAIGSAGVVFGSSRVYARCELR